MTTNIIRLEEYDEQADITGVPGEELRQTKNSSYMLDGQEVFEKVEPARLAGSAFEGALKKAASPSPAPLFELVDGELLVDPNQMEVNRPQMIDFEGGQIMVKKNPDGDIEFYAVVT